MEYHRLVHPVDKLGPKVRANDLHHSGFHGLVVALAGHLLNQVGAQVGRHHHDGIAKIHRAALAVGEPAIIQYLQQDVEHIRVRLLNFI